jgi:hypothetical protein
MRPIAETKFNLKKIQETIQNQSKNQYLVKERKIKRLLKILL